MTKITKIIIGVIVLAIIVAVGWKFYKNPAREEKGEVVKEPIKIGAIISLTGYASTYGEFAQKAINLAVKEINNKGGTEGRKVEVIFEDDHTEARDAVSAYQKLVSVDKVDGVIGGLWDFLAQPLMPLAVKDEIAFISPINFRIAGGFELNANTFVMMPEFKKVIEPLEVFIKDQNIKKLGTIRFKSPMGDEMSRILFDIMKRRGQTEIVDESYNEIGGNDFRTLVLKMKSKKVDAIFMDMLDSDMWNLVQRAKENGLKVKFLTHPIALDLFNNKDGDKTLVEGLSFVNWEAQPKEFSDAFQKEYGILSAKFRQSFHQIIHFSTIVVLSNFNRAFL